MRLRCVTAGVAGLLLALMMSGLRADDAVPTPEQAEFFETKVRPVFVEHCFECHSAKSKAIKGGLRLDTRELTVKGGDSGTALVPGKPDASALVSAVRWQDFEMPPKGKLRDDQVASIVKWVEMGAPWPAGSSSATESETVWDWEKLRSEHWSFQPVQRPALPVVNDTAWVQNEIDLFVLAGLDAAGLKPAPRATPEVLIRRLSFDLTGLPPTPAEVADFKAACETSDRHKTTAATNQLIDRLLDSPHYGERYGRHWLDVARYSDGYGGFLDSTALPSAWRYRDWVTESLNRDLSFDEFVRLQIAGDLQGADTAVATGFLALGPTYISDGGDPEATAQAMAETLDDRVDTVSRGLLGLTVSCARCHDHKFDPIPQLDYYSLAGVFRNTRNTETPLAPPEQVQAYQAFQESLKKLEADERKLRDQLRNEKREPAADEQAILDRLKTELAELKKNPVAPFPFAHAVAENGNRDMPLAIRGSLLKPGPVAPRRFLRLLAGAESKPFTDGSGRRELAAALTDPANPLLSRVFVNRLWLEHFGAGLVRTPSNFGKLGERPSHPQLLDWLAAEFVAPTESPMHASGPALSVKRLHRLLVQSATYQMSSRPNEHAQNVDGDNRLLWRMSPRRLDVEAWRDALLSVTGELDATIGGPPTEDVLSSRRRTLYAAVSRNGDRFEADTFLRLFDFPLPRATSEGRTTSAVPQQALFVMNNRFMAARARALAARMEALAPDNETRIARVYELLFARSVRPAERELGLSFLEAAQSATTTEEGSKQLSAWEQYAQVLLGSNEFLHLE